MLLAAPLAAELARRGEPTPVDLNARVESLVGDARAGWRGIDVAASTFVAYLAARWPRQAPLADWLEETHARDLYLACACAHRAPGAIEAFDRAFLPAVADYLARSQPDAAFVEDVRQTLREKLFVGAAAK